MDAADDSKTGVQSFRDLIVWQKSIELAELVYSSTRGFPSEELYGLRSQMRRAAVSIASNIAEGHSRNSSGEFLQFIGHAKGSLAELETQLVIAARLGYLAPGSDRPLYATIGDVGRLLTALRRSINRRKSESC